MARKFGGKKSSYVHNHTPNPKAHNSDERRLETVKNLQISRLQKIVTRLRNELSSFIPEDKRIPKKPDPLYVLKGAARAAQEFYRPPNYEEETKPIDLFVEFEKRLWEHEKGKVFLESLLELGINLHNVNNKTKQAINIFKEMISLDNEDHLCARHHLLRCYFDLSDAESARSLLDEYKLKDSSCCFMFARALIEHISFILEEKDSSDELRTQALLEAHKANEFAIFSLLYEDCFKDCVEHLDLIKNPINGSVEEALLFFEADALLWKETDGAFEWIEKVIKENSLSPPLKKNSKNSEEIVNKEKIVLEDNSTDKKEEEVSKKRKFDEEEININNQNKINKINKSDKTQTTKNISSKDESNSNNKSNNNNNNLGEIDIHEMFLGMFYTAIEMAMS